MTDPRLDGRARQRRNLGDGNAQQSEIAAGVSPDELRGNASTVGKSDLDFFVPLHNVVGGGDQTVRGPDDATCRVAAASVDRDDGCPGAFDGPGQLIGDVGQQRR